MLENILETYQDVELLKADGFDAAVVGIDVNTHRLIYSISKCIEILMERDEMEYSEATEYLWYNTINAYVGEKTPIWCDDEQ